MKKIFFMLILTFSISPVNSAPSFDCRKAQTEVEKQICTSDILSVLDVKLAARYNKLKKLYRGVTKSQRAWLKERNSSCEVDLNDERETCLVGLYGFQLAELEIIAKQDTYRNLTAICRNIATSYFDSGITTHMLKGGALTVTCLEGVLDSLGKNRIVNEQWSNLVRNAGRAVGKLNWVINNERKSCAGPCGSMYRVMHNATIIEFYEGIVENVYQLEDNNEL